MQHFRFLLGRVIIFLSLGYYFTFFFITLWNGLLYVRWFWWLCIRVQTDHDAVVHFTVIVKFVLSIGLSDSIIELDYFLAYNRCIFKHPLIEAFLSDSWVEGSQDEGPITHILDLLAIIKWILALIALSKTLSFPVAHTLLCHLDFCEQTLRLVTSIRRLLQNSDFLQFWGAKDAEAFGTITKPGMSQNFWQGCSLFGVFDQHTLNQVTNLSR